ncbi:hypothetical protein HHK36_030687 [Tetracentron sinense]|uniref:Uncharacterized protein n=1 Tax=Tetracentron sinense TaxID=13715 RepID=A0A834YC51_TETSI|nr:hypothetical protein HHK36_030687 [Tetracentron sinense]
MPHLIALANIRELMVMEHQPWEENAVRLQAEAVQLAKLQYLQYLLPSGTPLPNNSYGQTSITEMEAFNLLNSISQTNENPSLNSSQLEMPSFSSLGISTTQPLHNSIPFSHLPDLHVPCNSQTPLNSEFGYGSDFTMFSQGDIAPDSLWLPPSPSLPSPQPIDKASMSNLGGACSSSSYGGGAPSFWPELLLEDPFGSRRKLLNEACSSGSKNGGHNVNPEIAIVARNNGGPYTPCGVHGSSGYWPAEPTSINDLEFTLHS